MSRPKTVEQAGSRQNGQDGRVGSTDGITIRRKVPGKISSANPHKKERKQKQTTVKRVSNLPSLPSASGFKNLPKSPEEHSNILGRQILKKPEESNNLLADKTER